MKLKKKRRDGKVASQAPIPLAWHAGIASAGRDTTYDVTGRIKKKSKELTVLYNATTRLGKLPDVLFVFIRWGHSRCQ